MTTFTDALLRFNVTATDRVRDVFYNATEAVQRSIKAGSELTGAPGQPVRDGNLLSSWIGEFTSDSTWQITATGKSATGEPVGYAQEIEDGGNARGPFDPSRGDPRSEVGGYHSVKLTRAGWPRIVEHVAANVARGTNG